MTSLDPYRADNKGTPGISLGTSPASGTSFEANTLSQNNVPLAILAGLAAAVVSAGIWAAVTVATKFQIGWMAVGVGFLVGYAVRWGGKGTTPVFGVIGAALALLGCLLGNLLSTCGFAANEYELSFWTVLWRVVANPSVIGELFKATFQPMDLLFYGIAVYEGFRFSVRSAK
jgi:hypothetical protein